MSTSKKLPGTPRHQQLLKTITDFYEKDERVLSVLLFGSLGRGNWDQYSDLDLDIIMSDNTLIDARVELKKLCAAIKQKHGLDALIIADVEEGDVVLGNLVEFSIRYHILSDTKPAILDTMRSVSGFLSLDEIRAAANFDYNGPQRELADIVNEIIRYTLELHNAIMRQRIWMSFEMLHRIRASLMLIYAKSHDASRPIHFFDSHATPDLNKLLSNLSPQANLKSAIEAFRTTISLLENQLNNFCGSAYQLTTSQKQIIYKLKQTQIYRQNET
jgi:predicted nucleotidyltransferase